MSNRIRHYLDSLHDARDRACDALSAEISPLASATDVLADIRLIAAVDVARQSLAARIDTITKAVS